MSRFLTASLLLATLTGAGTTTADEGPSRAVPELQALNHYVGSWDVVLASKDAPFTKGQATAEWILDGRFVQQTGSLQARDGSASLKVTTLMTYDPAKKVYHTWTFLSNGSTSESEGTWDAKTRTMTSVSRKEQGGNTTTTTADFSQAGVEKWKIVVADRRGKVLSEMTGENTRRKK